MSIYIRPAWFPSVSLAWPSGPVADVQPSGLPHILGLMISTSWPPPRKQHKLQQKHLCKTRTNNSLPKHENSQILHNLNLSSSSTSGIHLFSFHSLLLRFPLPLPHHRHPHHGDGPPPQDKWHWHQRRGYPDLCGHGRSASSWEVADCAEG